MEAWKDAWRNRSFRAHLLITILLLLILVLFLPSFFNNYLQHKPGIQLSDWFLNQFTPRDFSWPIFILIYTAILIFLFRHSHHPVVVLAGLEAYLSLQVLRVFSLSAFTLEPPVGIIPLIDPFVSKVAYGTEIFNKDLFFSGHTATLFLLSLFEKSKNWKWFFVSVTICVALLILIQRVHYTVDIVAAPLAAWVAWRMGGSLTNRLGISLKI